MTEVQAPRRALVLCAGRGERLRPLTDTVPKPLLPVAGTPVAQRTLKVLARAGVESTALNLHHLGDRIQGRFGDAVDGMPLVYSPEEVLLGTLGPFGHLREFFRGVDPVLLVNGDSLCRWPVAAALEVHRASGADATLLLSSRADTRFFGGGVVTAPDGRVLSFRGDNGGVTRARRGVFAGMHLVSARLLEAIPPRPADIVRDLYEPLVARGGFVHGIYTRRRWHDLGLPSRYLRAVLGEARAHLAGRIRRGWRADDVTLGPGAKVRSSVLESAALVEAGASVEGSLLMDGAAVGKGATVSRSVLGPGVEIPDGLRVEASLVTRRRPDGALREVDRVDGDLVFTSLESPER